MPSEVADGRDAGTAPTKVDVYMLPEEELARYRGEEMHMRMKRFEERKPELLARFAAGEAETPAGKARLAQEFGVSVGTIWYHYNRWRKEQEENPGGEQAGDAAGPQLQTAPPAPSRAQGAAPAPVVDPPDAVAQSAEGVPSEPASTPESAAEQLAYPQPQERLGSEAAPAVPQPLPALPQDLCQTCVKRDVCLVADRWPVPARVMPTDDLPEKLRTMRVVLSPIYVQECSAYRAG